MQARAFESELNIVLISRRRLHCMLLIRQGANSAAQSPRLGHLVMLGTLQVGAPLRMVQPSTVFSEGLFDFASDPISYVCAGLFGRETADLRSRLAQQFG
jgi:hypothetical protein